MIFLRHLIDKTIESINTRIADIIQNDGERLKYYTFLCRPLTMFKMILIHVLVTVYDIFQTIYD